MNETSTDELIEQLRAMVAGRGDGIDIDTPFQWVVEDLKQPVAFFEHLPVLLPSDSILYVEGTSIAPEVAAFYAAHRARNAVEVVRDTISPVPDIYHFVFSPDVCVALRQFAERHPVEAMFDHIKAYRGESLLFTFHDAFCGLLCISERLPEETAARFCEVLGVSWRREETQERDPEQLRMALWAFENPDKIRIPGESWWKRLWRQWRAR